MNITRLRISASALVLLCAALGACSSIGPGAPAAGDGSVASAPGAVPVQFTGSAWDSFNHRGAVMWACRDIASGAIVANSMCHGLPQVDRQWPGMAVPPDYRGVTTD